MQAPILAPTAESIDPQARRRIIQRSLRCLTFAWIGLIPIAGSAMAVLAIRLHRQAMTESGEPFRHLPVLVRWAIGAPLAVIAGVLSDLNVHTDFGAGLAIAALFMALQSICIRRQFHAHDVASPVNPVRRQAFLGLELAYAGLFLGSALAWAILLLMLSTI